MDITLETFFTISVLGLSVLGFILVLYTMQRNSRLENIILEILNRMFDFVSRQRDNDNDNDKGD